MDIYIYSKYEPIVNYAGTIRIDSGASKDTKVRQCPGSQQRLRPSVPGYCLIITKS